MPFPRDPEQESYNERWAQAWQLEADRQETLRAALPQLRADLEGWRMITDLAAFVRGEDPTDYGRAAENHDDWS